MLENTSTNKNVKSWWLRFGEEKKLTKHIELINQLVQDLNLTMS